MTAPEIFRLVCYTIAVPAFLFLAFDEFHNRKYWIAIVFLSLSLLFAWYMIEITTIGQGLNTREYRVIGTPMIGTITVAASVMAGRVFFSTYHPYLKYWGRRIAQMFR